MITASNALLIIVIVSTLAFGAVEPWSLAITGILTAFLFSIFATRWQGLIHNQGFNWILLSPALIFAYGLFQLVPLPINWLSRIHPTLLKLFAIPAGTANLISHGQKIVTMDQVPAFHSISIYPFATEMELARLAMYLMIFVIAAFGPRTHEEIYSTIRLLAIFGFILALFAVTQKATWNGKLYWIRELAFNRGNPFGPFVNKNHFAGWLCMVAPLSFGIGLMSRSSGRKIRYIFFSVVMAITIFFTLSRGGIISFLIGTIILALAALWSVSSKKSLIPIFSFVATLLLYLAYLGISPIIERFAQSGLSSSERLLVWSASLRAFTDFPFFGTGFGTFQSIFPMYKPDGIAMFYRHAHNDYVEFLLEFGIVGAFFIVWFIVITAKFALSGSWRRREKYRKAGFLASIVSMAIFSLFDFNLHVPSNAILFSLVLGFTVAISRLEGSNQERRTFLSKSLVS